MAGYIWSKFNSRIIFWKDILRMDLPNEYSNDKHRDIGT